MPGSNDPSSKLRYRLPWHPARIWSSGSGRKWNPAYRKRPVTERLERRGTMAAFSPEEPSHVRHRPPGRLAGPRR